MSKERGSGKGEGLEKAVGKMGWGEGRRARGGGGRKGDGGGGWTRDKDIGKGV